MKLLLLSFVISLLLDERGCPLAFDQSQELIASHRHHHQRQQQPSTAHHKRHQHQVHHNNNNNNFNYGKNHNAPATTTIPTLTTTSAAAAAAYSKHLQPTTSSPTTTTASTTSLHRHHAHQQHQQQHYLYHHHHQHHSRSPHERILDGYRAPKSIKTAAISQQNFKFTPQNNRIDFQQDLHVARAVAAAAAAASSPSSTSSIATDYDDYVYDDDDVYKTGFANANFNNAPAALSQQTKHHHHSHSIHPHQYPQNQRQSFSDGAYQDHEYARVTRDHSHNFIINNDETQHDKDYAGDEPYRTNTEEVANQKKGELTAQKYREVGTPEAVQQSHNRHITEQHKQKMATQMAVVNLRRMTIATLCKYPLPRVVHVSNDTAKTYTPKAVLLHRCGEDTGCCTPGQVCTVKSTQNVTLYFFVVNLANELTTASLTLTNHTECECVDPRVLMQQQQRAKRSGQHKTATATAAASLRFSSSALDGDDEVDYESSDMEAAANAICRCPKHFDILREDERPAILQTENYGTCRCDCLNTNTPCQRLKDGEEGFPIYDRKCIDDRRCTKPTCSFGEYNSLQGRCPSSPKRSLPTHNDLGNG